MTQEILLEKLSIEFSELIERASKSIVLIRGRRSPFSGFALQKNLVVTADHLLPGADELQIQTDSGDPIPGVVTGRDPSLDIAFLKTTVDLVPLETASDGVLKTGQLGVSIGRASGGRLLALPSMISGSGGAYRNWRGGTLDQFLRLDVAPYPGFSGSALILPDGKLAGMNTSFFSKHFGLLVPASNIDRLAQKLSTKGSIGKPYLGLMMQPIALPEKMQKETGSEIGLIVIGIEKKSPAEEALLVGDIIVHFDEKAVNSIEEIHRCLTEASIGRNVNLKFLRGGNVQQVQVKIGERPLR